MTMESVVCYSGDLSSSSLFRDPFACGPHLFSLSRVRQSPGLPAWLGIGLAATHAPLCAGLFTRLRVHSQVASLFTDQWGQHLPSRREVEPKAAGPLGSKRGQARCCCRGRGQLSCRGPWSWACRRAMAQYTGC